jgi:hypothetical protein
MEKENEYDYAVSIRVHNTECSIIRIVSLTD